MLYQIEVRTPNSIIHVFVDLVCALVQIIWWRGDYDVGLLFRRWAWPLSSSEGNSASAYQDILGNFMLPTLWQQFGDGPFLFQHDCPPVHKARSIKTWMREFGVEELDWSAQSPDLNPIEHLWDELEQRLQARPSCPHQCLTSQMHFWKNGQTFP